MSRAEAEEPYSWFVQFYVWINLRNIDNFGYNRQFLRSLFPGANTFYLWTVNIWTSPVQIIQAFTVPFCFNSFHAG